MRTRFFVILIAIAVMGSVGCADKMRRVAYGPNNPLGQVMDYNESMTCMGPGKFWIPRIGWCLTANHGYIGREEGNTFVGYFGADGHRLSKPVKFAMVSAAGAGIGYALGGAKGAVIGGLVGAGGTAVASAIASHRQNQQLEQLPEQLPMQQGRQQRQQEVLPVDTSIPPASALSGFEPDGPVYTPRTITVRCPASLKRLRNATSDDLRVWVTTKDGQLLFVGTWLAWEVKCMPIPPQDGGYVAEGLVTDSAGDEDEMAVVAQMPRRAVGVPGGWEFKPAFPPAPKER